MQHYNNYFYRIALQFKNIMNKNASVNVPIQMKNKSVMQAVARNYGITQHVPANAGIPLTVLQVLCLIALIADAFQYQKDAMS